MASPSRTFSTHHALGSQTPWWGKRTVPLTPRGVALCWHTGLLPSHVMTLRANGRLSHEACQVIISPVSSVSRVSSFCTASSSRFLLPLTSINNGFTIVATSGSNCVEYPVYFDLPEPTALSTQWLTKPFVSLFSGDKLHSSLISAVHSNVTKVSEPATGLNSSPANSPVLVIQTGFASASSKITPAVSFNGEVELHLKPADSQPSTSILTVAKVVELKVPE
jgi:hypothetical protein